MTIAPNGQAIADFEFDGIGAIMLIGTVVHGVYAADTVYSGINFRRATIGGSAAPQSTVILGGSPLPGNWKISQGFVMDGTWNALATLAIRVS